VADEDSLVSRKVAPEPELAPYQIEAARSSRSKCRTCRRKIEKGKLRLGILLEGPFGTGYLWHHLACAARQRLEDVEAAYAQKAFGEGLKVPPLSELQTLEEKAARARAERKEPPFVERAPTGRSKCKHCGEPIGKDDLRVALAREVAFGSQVRTSAVNVHVGCVVDEIDTEDCATDIDGFGAALRQNSDDASLAEEALAAIGVLDDWPPSDK